MSIRRSAALLTMLAQVNYLILPRLIALNHKLYPFSTHLLILLLKLYGNRLKSTGPRAMLQLWNMLDGILAWIGDTNVV